MHPRAAPQPIACLALPYDEPWGWMQPTRHAYRALLLEQDRVEEAEAVYPADLGYDPSIPRSTWHAGNVWSLHGYHECLVRLGKAEPARIVKPRLDVVLARRRRDQLVVLLPPDPRRCGRLGSRRDQPVEDALQAGADVIEARPARAHSGTAR
jgi:hypothetical protein